MKISNLNKITIGPKRISHQERLLFTKHLSIMVKSGIPLSEALDTLKEQTKSTVLANILEEVSNKIKNGESLSKAFGKFPKAFDKFFISLIQAGEESGSLEENLAFLAKQIEKSYSLRKKVQAALLYPSIIFLTTIIMGGFISFFILPQLVDFFEAFEFPLPLATKVLLGFAGLMKNHGALLLGSTTGLITSLYLLSRTKTFRPKWDKMMLSLPLLGKVIKMNSLANLTRSLGVLLKSGLPIDKSLGIVANSMSNLVYKKAIHQVAEAVNKGSKISTSMEKLHPKEFPLLIIKMIGVGEKTGKLDETLLYLGDFYEEEIDYFNKNLSTTLEPIMLIFIGLIVGFVAIAIISPIYELTGSIRRQ